MKSRIKTPVISTEKNGKHDNDLHNSNLSQTGREASTIQPLKLSQAAHITVILLGLVAFAYFARALVLPVLLAWVVSMALKPPVTWLRARHLPAPLAAGIIVAIVVAAAACAIFYLGRPAATWIKSSPQTISQLKQKYESVARPFTHFSAATSDVAGTSTNKTDQKSAPTATTPETPTPDVHVIGTVFNWTGSAIAGVGETVALLFLLLASGDTFMQKLVRVMPSRHDKKHAVEMSREIQQNISRYLFSISLINLGLGAVVGTAFYFLGLPNAAMWGAIAAAANFIPYFGPVLGMIAVALTGLLAFDTASQGLIPAGVYLMAHLIEANLVTPFALGRRFALNPVIIFVFLIFCVWLWGVVGAFLSAPLLVTAKVICDHVKKLSPVGELLSD